MLTLWLLNSITVKELRNKNSFIAIYYLVFIIHNFTTQILNELFMQKKLIRDKQHDLLHIYNYGC
jgi:hypothetical protein